MIPLVFVLGWLGFLFVGLGVAGLLELSRTPATVRFLGMWFGLGSLALLVMAVPMVHPVSRDLILPRPWPRLVLAPLPLAPLWSVTAGLLFGATNLAILAHPHRRNILYALLPLQAMVGIYLWSGDGLLLLMSWELISALSYIGVVAVRRARPVWNAGWALLALSEFGGMLLLLAMAWITRGSSHLQDGFLRLVHLDPTLVLVIMVLTLVAFGVKAGLFPVMVWIPMAEPEAPGVVAGLFSGLLTALAISGILEIDRILRPGLSWGIVLLVLGVLGALTGALYSVLARHVKRILAYSTLEILGLVFAALGIWHIESVLSPSNIAATMALDGAVILLVMHAGAKFALFTVTDYTERWGHTLDRLGGLIHRGPYTAFWALVSILTLGAVPPLGGFVGEWLILESILKSLGPTRQNQFGHVALVVAGAFLAVAVALGTLAYLRWFSFIFLGPLHQKALSGTEEAPRGIRWGLALVLVFPVASGPLVPWFLPWLNQQLGSLISTPRGVIADTFINPHAALPLIPIGVNLVPAPGATGTVFFPQGFSVGDPYVLWLLGMVLVAVLGILRHLSRRYGVRKVSPWTGGLEPYTAKTSWSAEGFVHPIRLAFGRVLGLKRSRFDTERGRFYRHTIIYRVEAIIYQPILLTFRWIAQHIRRIQSGRVTQYVAYVWVALIFAIILGVTRG